VHFRSNCVEFSIAGPDRAYELVIHYEDEKIDWNKVNDRLSEVVNKTIDNIKGSQKVNLRILFNEKTYVKPNAGEPYVDSNDYFVKNLNFISKIQSYLTSPARAIHEVEYIIDKLALDKLFHTFKHLFIICINYESNQIYGKLAKDANKKFNTKFTLTDMCLPVQENDKLVLKNVSEVFFAKEKDEDKLVILASVVSNLHLMFERHCSNFAIFENEQKLLASEAKAKELNTIVDEYIERSTRLSKEDQEARKLNIIVAKIDLKEYIKI